MKRMPSLFQLIDKMQRMSNAQIIMGIVGLSLIFVIIGLLVGDAPTTVLRGPKPQVSIGFFPVSDIASQIGGEVLEISAAIPPNQDVYQFQPDKKQLTTIAESKLFFKVGHGIDAWTNGIEAINNKLEIVELDTNVFLLPTNQGQQTDSFDPHYWLSIPDTLLFSKQIADELSETFPERDAFIKENHNSFASKLAKLDNDFRGQLSNFSEPSVFLLDPAWKYLVRDYGILVTDEMNMDLAQLTQDQVVSIATQIRNSGSTTVIMSRNNYNGQLVNQLEEIGIRVAVLDKFGGTSQTITYLDLMTYNINVLISSF